MEQQVTADDVTTGLKRRSIVKGSAWAVPTIVIGSAAPPLAASDTRPPGLQGWVTVGKNCGFFTNKNSFSIDGTGGGNANPPNGSSKGLWVFKTNSTTTFANARITFYYPNSTGTITWTAESDSSGWSVPVKTIGVDPAFTGYTAYTTYYTGGWTFYNSSILDDQHHRANGRPHFTGSWTSSNCGSVSVYAQRTVTVIKDRTETVTFRRGPVTL